MDIESKLENIKDLTLLELAELCMQAKQGKESFTAMVDVINDEVADRVRRMKVNGTKVGSYFVGWREYVSVADVPYELASELGAIKKVKDEAKLRSLHKQKVKIMGIKTSIKGYVKENNTEDMK